MIMYEEMASTANTQPMSFIQKQRANTASTVMDLHYPTAGRVAVFVLFWDKTCRPYRAYGSFSLQIANKSPRRDRVLPQFRLSDSRTTYQNMCLSH